MGLRRQNTSIRPDPKRKTSGYGDENKFLKDKRLTLKN